MPASPRWTDAELASLDNFDLDYERFCALHGRYRSYEAWRQRRAKQGLSTHRGQAVETGAAIPSGAGFAHIEEALTFAGAAPAAPDIVGVTAREDPDIETIRRQAEARFTRAARQARARHHQHVRFTHGPVALFFIGDQHIGSSGTDVARMFHEQELINATPGAHVVCMGDVVDNYVIGKLMAQNMHHGMTVVEEWELARHYMHGWSSLLAVSSGNHPQWTQRLVGIDYDREITPDGVLYDTDELLFDVHVGTARVKVRIRHKWKGSSIYNVTHALEKSAKFDTSEPDVFVGAHIHQGAVSREFIHDGKRKLALMSSTYKVHDPYQRQEGFASNDASTAVALVIRDDGSFWGSSDLPGVLDYMRTVYRE